MARLSVTGTARWAAMVERAKVTVQAHIDATARERDYADGVACASYKTSTINLWAAEAATFIAWRDAVWATMYALLAEVDAGQAVPPANEAELLALLPVMEWPSQ
jgi:hypothetical protein